VARVLRRRPPERLAAWIVTGPIGHLYGSLADIALLWGRWGLSRVRARLSRAAG
jgi:hypothetical protein